jgi:hypothetical protein
MGEKWNAYMVWVRKPEGKRPPGRSRHRYNANIKVDNIETGRSVWLGFRIRTSGRLMYVG